MKRILALDGGGLRGVVAASFLAKIEEQIGGRAADYFDLIAGTSAGGLTALGLGLGFSAEEVLHFYEKRGPRIFERRKRKSWLIPRGLMSQLYDLDKLKAALNDLWQGKRLSDSRSRLLVPTFNVQSGKTHVWRTAHHPDYAGCDDAAIVDVALSTSAAPIYFQSYRSSTGMHMVDGGVWANCPVMTAVTEAITALDWKPKDIAVLSLGSSFAPFRASGDKPLTGGMWQWSIKLPQLFIAAQEDAALGMARSLCGADNVVRVDPPDPSGTYAVDNPADIPRFRSMGANAAEEAFPKLRELFFQAQAEPFERFTRMT